MLDPSHPITKLLQEDRRYAFEAYVFVFEALGYAQNVLEMGTESPSQKSEGSGAREDDPEAVERHVSGQELCEGARQLALERFGYMARTVLESWGVQATDDFGRLVYIMIGADLLRKADTDSIDDFHELYDFRQAFDESFRIELERRA